MMYYGQADVSGVQPMILPQDTSEAARQAITPQAPGSEFSPAPHPDIPRILARMKELDKLCTSICDKLWMAPGGKQPTWEEREDLREELATYDRERAGLNKILEDLYEGSGSDNDKGESPPDPYKQAPAVVIGEDRAPGDR